MSERPTFDETADAAAWSQAVLRRQVERLDELAEAGLVMAKALQVQVTEGTAAPEAAAMAFSRIARAARMAGLLQSRLIKDMDEARRLKAAARSPEQVLEDDALEAARLDPAHRHKFRVERIVERLIKAEHDDEETIDRLCIEAGERLDDDDIYGDVLNRPVGELVALICRDLGLDPDWSRLAQEAWARVEGVDPSRPPPFSAGDGGGGPSADQPMGAGESPIHPPFHSPPERHLHPTG